MGSSMTLFQCKRKCKKFLWSSCTKKQWSISLTSAVTATCSSQNRMMTPSGLLLRFGPVRRMLFKDTQWSSVLESKTTLIWSGLWGWWLRRRGDTSIPLVLLMVMLACYIWVKSHTSGNTYACTQAKEICARKLFHPFSVFCWNVSLDRGQCLLGWCRMLPLLCPWAS